MNSNDKASNQETNFKRLRFRNGNDDECLVERVNHDFELKRPSTLGDDDNSNRRFDPLESSLSSESSDHNSEDHDEFVTGDVTYENKRASWLQRYRSASLTGVREKSQRNHPNLARSLSLDRENNDTNLTKDVNTNGRQRSKSCAGAMFTIPTWKRSSRIRKISTNSLGSFGTGFEGLLTSKAEIRLTPQGTPIPSPESPRKSAETSPQEDHPKTKPRQSHKDLDRGYAWVVLFGAGLAFFLGGGFGRCFPLVYQRLVERFHSSATATAWVAAMHGAVKLCSSPIVSALCNKLGLRVVVIIGGVIAASGLALSAFPPSLAWIYLTYSTISAFGSNMVHAPSFIIVGQYFDKKKGTAMAIATTCLTLGGVAFAPLIEVFFSYYGYSGALLLTSSIMLHYCVTGMLYRAPPVGSKGQSREKGRGFGPSGVDKKDSKDCNQESLKNELKSDHETKSDNEMKSFIDNSNDKTRNKELTFNKKSLEYESDESNQKSENKMCCLAKASKENDQQCKKVDFDKSTQIAQDVVINIPKSQGINFERDNVTEKNNCCKKCFGGVLAALKILARHLGLQLLRDWECLGYGLLMGAAFWAFGISNTFIAGLGYESAKIDHSAMAVILSVTSASDIACRILSGIIFDIPKLKPHRTSLFLWISALGGGSTALLPFMTSYASFFVVFAFCSGMKSALHTQHVTVLSHLVGPKKLASAMGLVRFFQGVGVMVGLAIGGILTDSFHTFSLAFIVSGVSFIFVTAIFTSRHYCCVKQTNDGVE